MTPVRPPRHVGRQVGRIGFAFAVGLALLPARGAGAAGTDCSGSWRFDVTPATPDKEAWLSADSWCRAAKLPRTFSAELRTGPDGRAVVTGTPLRPTDVMAGSGRCEFQFAGPAASPTKVHELSIEVNASGTPIQGKARCAERTKVSDEKTDGISIELAVTGTRSTAAAPAGPSGPGAAVPAGADKAAAAVVAACRKREAPALWKMMTPRFRSELDGRAADVRRSVPAADLRSLFGHKGRPATFKGEAFLRHAVAEDSPANPCWRVERWDVRPAAATSSGFVVPVQSADDLAFGLTFTRNGRGWLLDQISKSVPAPKR
jgi:hypothetical protein